MTYLKSKLNKYGKEVYEYTEGKASRFAQRAQTTQLQARKTIAASKYEELAALLFDDEGNAGPVDLDAGMDKMLESTAVGDEASWTFLEVLLSCGPFVKC